MRRAHQSYRDKGGSVSPRELDCSKYTHCFQVEVVVGETKVPQHNPHSFLFPAMPGVCGEDAGCGAGL